MLCLLCERAGNLEVHCSLVVGEEPKQICREAKRLYSPWMVVSSVLAEQVARRKEMVQPGPWHMTQRTRVDLSSTIKVG